MNDEDLNVFANEDLNAFANVSLNERDVTDSVPVTDSVSIPTGIEKDKEGVSRHTQTQKEIEDYFPLFIYYIPLSYDISYVYDGECMICFEKKHRLKWSNKIVRSRIEPPYHLYFDSDALIQFVDKNPNDTFILTNEYIVDFDRIEKSWFRDNELPDHLILPFPCNKHEICMACLRNILSDYSNHPINHNHSHLTCQFPFENCNGRLEHSHVEKVLNENSYCKYLKHVEIYEFPGFKKVKCPGRYSILDERQIECKAVLLVDIDDIEEREVGDLIMRCVDPLCYGNFCYHCKKSLSYFQESCFDCKMKNENTNPLSYNYFFNTPFNESSGEELVLYRNCEITFDIAVNQLISLIEDINSFFICPICKISMTKSEKCNAISHHEIERCFVCGRIGQAIKGLSNHWNERGIGGCYRFHSDHYPVFLFNYQCLEGLCHNHELGECNVPEHQFSLIQLEIDRKRAFVLHAINSLLPELRFRVYDHLYEYYSDLDSIDLFYLPDRSTLELLIEYPQRYTDYSEKIIIEQVEKTKKMN